MARHAAVGHSEAAASPRLRRHTSADDAFKRAIGHTIAAAGIWRRRSRSRSRARHGAAWRASYGSIRPAPSLRFSRGDSREGRLTDPLSRLRGDQRRPRGPRGITAAGCPSPSGRPCAGRPLRYRPSRSPGSSASSPSTAEDLQALLRRPRTHGEGPGRAASLAARFAARRRGSAVPREAALGQIEPADFSVARDNYGAPRLVAGHARRNSCAASPCLDLGVAHALSSERVGGGASRAREHGRAGGRPVPV